MKRAVTFFLSLLVLSLLLCTPVAAQDTDRYFSDLLDALPGDVRDALSDAGSAEAADELLGAERLFSLFLDAAWQGAAGALSSLPKFLGTVLILCLLSYLARDLSAASADAAQLGVGLILSLLLFRFATADFSRTTECLSDMASLSGALVPIFFGLFASGGATATATSAAAGFTAFSYLLQNFCISVLLPLLHLVFAFTAMRAAGGRLKTDSLFSSLRTTYVTALSFLSLLLVTSLGFQSSLSASSDSLATGAMRFTVGQMIPVVGGSLSGSLRTLAASLSLIKGTLGGLSALALLLLVLPPLVELLFHRLLLSLSASVCDMLGNERGREAFLSFRGIYDLAAATLAVSLVLFLLILSLLVRCGLPISLA